MPWPDRFEEIVRRIRGQRSGQLHAVIHRLLDAQEARDVCTYCGVTERMTAREEEECLAKRFGYPCWKKFADKVGRAAAHCAKDKEEALTQCKVHTALMIIGCWYSELKGRFATIAPMARPAEGRPNAVLPRAFPLGPAALALVIRSSKLGDLPAVSQLVPTASVLDWISNAVYFRCALPADADAKEGILGVEKTSGPSPGPTREHDVYLRLDIENGGVLLDAESPFALKNRLRDGPPRTIRLVRQAPLDCPAESLHDFHSI